MSDALYIVDGSGFIFRAYHALPPLTTKTGVPTGAVFGFAQMLIKLEFDHRPTHLVVVFDAGARTFRNDLYAEYKAHRPEPPEDLKPQFAMVRRLVKAFGVVQLDATGFEADDIIATLAKRAEKIGMRAVIVSSDKDLMQLVDDNCVLVDTMKDVTYGEAEVEAKFGVPPKKLGDVLALMGDSVDNVPGVPGVGPKTATALISHFGSLDAMLAGIDGIAEIPGLRGAKSVRDKIAAHVGDIRLSRKLVALEENLPLDLDLSTLERKVPDTGEVEAMLREIEALRLMDRLHAKPSPSSSPTPAPAAAAVATASDLARLARPPRIIDSRDALTALAEEVTRAPRVALCVETAGPSEHTASIIGIALALPDGPPAYLPLEHRYLGAPKQLSIADVRAALGPWLADATRDKLLDDSKHAELALARGGISLAGVRFDAMLASYLLSPDADHELGALSVARLGATVESRAMLLGTGKRALTYDAIEIARAATFAASRAEATLALAPVLLAELERQEVMKLYREIELPLAHVLAVVEAVGIKLDVALLRTLAHKVDDQLRAIEDDVRRTTGSDVNLGSPKQLQELLFGKLGLPAIKKTKTGLSTDAEVLEELAPLHPVAARILEHRVLAKLKGTYLDTLPQLVAPATGRLHTSYQQAVAATGRLSSKDPNLQNVPVRTELGREIRRAFIADTGCSLVVADYSQIELRVLAHLSEDAVLVDAFQKDQDIHRRTVVEMFGEAKADDPEMRRVAKMINYGIIYGLSDFGLAQRLGIERKAAKEYIEGYLRTYAGVARFMERIVLEAHKAGRVRTLLGRIRTLPELASKNRNIRMYGERMARNTPIQGAAADLLKVAMIEVQQMIEREERDTRMLLTVHDELVLEAPTSRAEILAGKLSSVMENVMKLKVPLKVDVGWGPTWADAK